MLEGYVLWSIGLTKPGEPGEPGGGDIVERMRVVVPSGVNTILELCWKLGL